MVESVLRPSAVSEPFQATLREPIAFEGIGIHTGRAAKVTISPRPAGTGIVFRLNGKVEFPAHASYIVDTRRATVLGVGEDTVSTVEHLLSALMGMGVDNALIDVLGPEIPVMDGSAQRFAEAIAATGTVLQAQPRARYAIAGPEFFRDGERTLAVLPSAVWRIKYTIEYPPPVGTQFVNFEVTPEAYLREISKARTFAMLSEVEALRRNGLAQGGSLENAVIFGPEGPLTPLRYPNEPVRHKVLDIIGDFALLGMRPQCEIVAVKSGHSLHCTAVAELIRGQGSKRAAAVP